MRWQAEAWWTQQAGKERRQEHKLAKRVQPHRDGSLESSHIRPKDGDTRCTTSGPVHNSNRGPIRTLGIRPRSGPHTGPLSGQQHVGTWLHACRRELPSLTVGAERGRGLHGSRHEAGAVHTGVRVCTPGSEGAEGSGGSCVSEQDLGGLCLLSQIGPSRHSWEHPAEPRPGWEPGAGHKPCVCLA